LKLYLICVVNINDQDSFSTGQIKLYTILCFYLTVLTSNKLSHSKPHSKSVKNHGVNYDLFCDIVQKSFANLTVEEQKLLHILFECTRINKCGLLRCQP